jgi:hypothetical protein
MKTSNDSAAINSLHILINYVYLIMEPLRFRNEKKKKMNEKTRSTSIMLANHITSRILLLTPTPPPEEAS